MATAAAILLTLCTFVFIPLIIGFAIGGIMVSADRRKRKATKSNPLARNLLKKEEEQGSENQYVEPSNTIE